MNLYQTLKHYFGYDTLRPGQQDLMEGILNGSDVLGIMPTGAGKSLCYQVPALMLPGITIVISPLISLMSDQVKALNQAGVHAAYINSSLTENQIRAALLYAAQGQYKIIYVAPERLNTMRFLDFACRADISMVTVDEAHCISQWGQDFRPSYLEIADFLARLPRRPVVSAFTATATERVKQDITGSLHLQNPVTVVTGFSIFCFSILAFVFETDIKLPFFSIFCMIARRIVVAIPRMIASSAAISLDPVILANVLIIGLIVWKSGPPTIKGPDIVLNAAIKVSTVIAKMVGFIVGSTILNKIVLWDAPIFFAASIV